MVVDAAGQKVSLLRGSSDAALALYHVERSKLFVLDRLASVKELDGARTANAIEHSRFPFASLPDDYDIGEWAALLPGPHRSVGRCAILERSTRSITNSREIGLHRQLGYESPADLVDKYPSSTGTGCLRILRTRSAS
jgi:hypothetical protein